MHAVVEFDGACSGNPGPMGGGAIVTVGRQRDVLSVPLGRGTSNAAEYGGLIAGLRRALDLGATTVTIRGDSQLVIRQLEGSYAIRAPNLKALHGEAMRLLARFSERRLEWVARERNTAADAAARRALG